MYKLYHHSLSPSSRLIRVILAELKCEFSLIKEDYWRKNTDFMNKSPGGILPIFEIDDDKLITGYYPIIEFLNESHKDFYLIKNDEFGRAKIRELINWFNEKFYREVTKILIDEKIIRLLLSSNQPRTNFIKIAKSNLTHHFHFLNDALKTKSFLIGETISIADIAAAVQLSILDYLGEIDWDNLKIIKHWYSLIKSRPSFQPLLHDRIPGFNPPNHYDDLDF